MALPLPNLGPRARKIVRYACFALVGLISFIFAFQLSFPFDRVKDKAIEALSEKYETQIGDVQRSWIPGRVYFKAVTLRTRPTKPGDLPSTLYVEQVEVDVRLLPLLHGSVVGKMDLKIGPGHIKIGLDYSSSAIALEIDGDDVPSGSLPMREVIGLPMSGKLRFAFNVELPINKGKTGKPGVDLSKGNGHLELACPTGCVVGDGKTKLKMALKNQRQQAFAEGGIDFGKLSIDSLLADLDLKDGKLELTKLEAKSNDGEVHADVDITFNQDVMSSPISGCLRFRGSDTLLKNEPKTHAALSTTGAPLGPDNLFHIRLDGTLRDVKRLPQVCGQGVSGKSMDNPGGTPSPISRPTLPPAEHTGSSTTTPPPAAAPPPPPAAAPPPAMPQPEGSAGSAGSGSSMHPEMVPMPEGQPATHDGQAPPPIAPPPTQPPGNPSPM